MAKVCRFGGENAAETAEARRYVNCKEVRDRRNGKTETICVRRAARGMAWIELHQSLPQHRKLLALRDALGLRTPAALGHMCLLWLWALDNAPDGDLSALPARQLAEICQFNVRRAGDLAAALRTSGFVDADGRLHDWGDYTGRLIDQRAASRERQRRRRARLRLAAMEESKEDGT